MKKELLKKKIYDYVATNVQSGYFAPGAKICEETLAKELNVSRTPVRDALSQLSFEGVVEKIPHRGFFVRNATPEKLNELYQVIGHLDKLVASLACAYMDEKDYRKMQEIIDKMDLAIRYENFPDYSQNQNFFHSVYSEKCPNKTLCLKLNELTHNHIPHTYTGSGSELYKYCDLCNKEHKQILDSFMSKDYVRLQELIVEHWIVVVDDQYI